MEFFQKSQFFGIISLYSGLGALGMVSCERAHRDLSFGTKFKSIGPCVQILRPKNHQN